MAEIELATPENLVAGVMVTPPEMISASIKRHVEQALAEIPPGKSGAMVAVATTDGVNLVFAHRTATDWEVAAWVGKQWRNKDLLAGVAVKKTW